MLARFISADTIVPGSGALTLWPSDATAAPLFAQANAPGPQNPQELNRYAYGLNNPVKYTDPTGHCPMCAAGALVFVPGVGQILLAGGVIFLTGVAIYQAVQIGKGLHEHARYAKTAKGQLEKAARSEQKLIKEHEDKLKDYLRDPDAYDNDGRLNRARTPEERRKIIEGRAKVLREAIERHKKELEKIRERLAELE